MNLPRGPVVSCRATRLLALATALLVAACGGGGGSGGGGGPGGPTAAFTFTAGALAVGASVAFTDTSSGSPTDWAWDFDDGTSSTQRNPTHAFAAAGAYAVTLTAASMAGSDSVTRVVVVGNGSGSLAYPIVDTGQALTYDASSQVAPPAAGQPFHGQDAQFAGAQPSYVPSADGTTVFDAVTGLTWMSGPNMTLASPASTDKKTYSGAQAWVATVNGVAYGGFSDWRLPTIKELYSLIDFRGTDPSGFTGSDTSVLSPFLDTGVFRFAYGQTSAGERIIDSQYASSTVFVLNPADAGSPKLFGVNFADGRIKGYDLVLPGGMTQKTFFVQLVRGPTTYGTNQLVSLGDGTVLDQATGLTWMQADSGTALTWQEALAWAGARNTESYLGHADWRLPNAKELQGLLDYRHAPDYDGLPAIDTAFFSCSPIVNENGDADFPWYWTSTTHAGWTPTGTSGERAAYIPFGRALGWPTGATRWVDVHGAGCQRSDPKVGPPFPYATTHVVNKGGINYTGYAFGPQGDALRGRNHVRLVRGTSAP